MIASMENQQVISAKKLTIAKFANLLTYMVQVIIKSN